MKEREVVVGARYYTRISGVMTLAWNDENQSREQVIGCGVYSG